MFYIGYFCVIFLTVISYNFGFLLQEHQLCICLIYFVCIPYLSYNLQASCLFILYTLFSDPSSPFLAVFSTVLNLSAASNLYLDLHFCDFAGGGFFFISSLNSASTCLIYFCCFIIFSYEIADRWLLTHFQKFRNIFGHDFYLPH